MVELSDNLIEKPCKNSSPHIGEGIVIDIGTGDGLFVYQCAHQNPRKFYIGIDANASPLEKISEKIYRKPAKGGLPNILYIQAAVEELPSELYGVANEVHIHFPWGSLLRAVAIGDEKVLHNLRQICAKEALLEIVIGLDPERDCSEIARLGLKPLSIEYMDAELIPRFHARGFEILERGILTASEWPNLKTSWAKRLKGNQGRSVTYIIARAV
ncbi:MAG: class I SAM-dependent methyltransferase [Acidobacteriota bacterium]